MTLDDAKKYLKVDSNDDDTLIQELITAAESYIKQQTGKTKKIVNEVETDISTDELYSLCLKMLLAGWYENRGPQITGTVMAKVDHSVDALISHISLCGDYV
jgi:uncharacterized phage protein (predicted DNA packaging)